MFTLGRQAPPSPASRLAQLLPLALSGVVFLAALILTWEGGVLWGKHADAVEDWSEEISHLSYEVADSIDGAQKVVEIETDRHLLPLAQSVLLGATSAAKVLPKLLERIDPLRQVRVVALFGANGELILSSDPALQRRNISVEDRDFFQLMRFNGAASFTSAAYLNRPGAGEPVSRLYILSIRGLRDANGVFAGILVVAEDPEILLRTRLDSPVLKRAEIRLFEENGRLLSIPPAGLSAVGTRYSDSALFRLEDGLPRIGILPNPFDGTPELAALRRVGNSRLLVSVKIGGGPHDPRWWYLPVGCLVGAVILFTTTAWLLLWGGGIAEWFGSDDTDP